jgi:hypothetical protein
MPIAHVKMRRFFLFKELHFTLCCPPVISESLYFEQKAVAQAMEKRLQAYVETGILSLRSCHIGAPEQP